MSDPKQSGYLRWLTFVQEKWFRGHTSYLHVKLLIVSGCCDKLFPKKCELYGQKYPRVMWTKFQDPQKLKLKFNNNWFLRLQIISLCDHTYSRTSLTFLVFKMGLNTTVAQSVSTLRAKSWKVPMKSTIWDFFYFV